MESECIYRLHLVVFGLFSSLLSQIENRLIDVLEIVNEARQIVVVHFLDTASVGDEHFVIGGGAVEQVDGEFVFMETGEAVDEFVVGVAER